MSIFTIKVIACVAMVLDHIKYAVPGARNFVTVYFGRIAFPLFAFMLVEGYEHTSNLKKYYQRLVIAALISQIPFMLFRTLVGEWKMLNVMFTLLLGLLAIMAWDQLPKKHVSILLVAELIALGEALHVDYGAFGVATVFLLYILREHRYARIGGFAALVAVHYAQKIADHFFMDWLYSCVFTILPIVILIFYNGKLGKKIKYFYYVFYPLHLLILYGLKIFLK